MFTLPAKIQLEILIDNSVVDLIDLIVPGGHVKSLTSASRLIKEYEFSYRQHVIDERSTRGDYLMTKDEDTLLDDEKTKFKQACDDFDESDIDGSVFIKAEWEGFGEYMPPARSETLFQLDTLKKNRFECSKAEQ